MKLTIMTTVMIATSCAGGRHNMPPPPASWPLTDRESGVRVTCDVVRPTSVPISVFLGLSVLDLGPFHATDVVRQTPDVRQHHRLMPPPSGREHNTTEFSMSDFRREMDISTSKGWLALDFLLIFISISCLFDRVSSWYDGHLSSYENLAANVSDLVAFEYIWHFDLGNSVFTSVTWYTTCHTRVVIVSTGSFGYVHHNQAYYECK